MTRKRDSSPKRTGTGTRSKPASTPKRKTLKASPVPAEICDTAPGPCFVVGIGASAGGQAALEHLFTAMPPDCDLSFVVVMHLPPEGPSFLTEIFRPLTSMDVVTVTEGMLLQANRVHVIPGGCMLTVKEGRLHLEDGGKKRSPPHPIDRFFESLADDAGARAMGVVLSGFGVDGAEGVKAIKKAGGAVLVQDPASAVHPAMPKSAIATGAADLILPVEEMPEKIAALARGTCNLPPQTCLPRSLDEDLNVVFNVVKAKTGHDFSSYKRNTVMRRLERRMALNEVSGLGKYIALLQENGQEAQALGQEILIGVTSFFRDPEAFESLRREVLPRLFANRDPDDPVRIWHACCATGEEVYSMAILIREYLAEQGQEVLVRFFASDIDETSIAQARAGLYPVDIEEEVGAERLAAWFTRTEGRYQVAKELREMVVFAHHSLIKDPPFSRLDLLVCRNFLIYLNSDMQKRLISLFHQVIKPNSFLFLGGAESVGRHSDLFTPVDKKWKIFQRRENGPRAETFFPFSAPVRKFSGTMRSALREGAEAPSSGTMVEKRLMDRYVPPCVVVNEKYEIVHVAGRMNRFLEVPAGEPTRDILKLAREELRPSLRAAIYKTFSELKQVVFRGVKLTDPDGGRAVNVLVEPVSAEPSAGRLAMVVFEPALSTAELLPSASGAKGVYPGDDASKDMLIRQLEEQLGITHEQLQATTEQLETSNEGFTSTNEELMSINEEFQSANEELQSTNEELETSKEELQALNEELVTVNAELQGKVEELNRANSDMENLLHSSEIATIFLDRNLNIKRFTPAAAAIFNLIPADLGRPFRRLAGAIDWPTLTQDAETVLAGQPFAEREVTALEKGRTFLKRLFPYRTSEGKIEGLVVIFLDITERKRMEVETRHLASFPQVNPNPVLELDSAGKVVYANPVIRKILQDLGLKEGDFTTVLPPDLDAVLRDWDGETETMLSREVTVGERDFSLTIHLVPQFGVARIYGYDATVRKRAEEAVQRAKEEWERTFNSVPDLIAILDNQSRIVRVNQALAKRLKVSPEECVGQSCYQCLHKADQAVDSCPHALTLADGREHEAEVHEDLLGGDFLVTTSPLLDENGGHIGSVHIARDITERKRAEEAIREGAAQVRLALEAADLGAWDYRLDSGEVFWDERCRNMFGVAKGRRIDYDEAISRIHPEDRQDTDKAVKRAITGGNQGRYRREFRVVWPDGSVHWVASLGRVYFEGEGELRRAVRFIGVNREITESKQAEVAQARLAAIVQSTDDAVISKDLEGTILSWNVGAERLFGYREEEVVGRTFSLLPPDRKEEEGEIMRQLAAGQPVEHFETVHLTKDGRRVEVSMTSFPIRDSAGRIIGASKIIHDITDRIRAEETLREAKEAAEAATQAKSRFLANMSHELRTPMTGVLGMLELALGGSLAPKERDCIGMAHQSAKSLLRILDDILDLTKIEAGMVSLEEKAFVLRECVVGSVDILLPVAQSKGVGLNHFIADDLPHIMIGDQVRLRQVLTNLVGNAVKFTERGQVVVQVTAGGRTSDGRREVVWTVRDTGIGIPEEKQHLLFRSFSQVDDSNSRKYGGTGLGLAISREIVERMGGAMSFESKAGVGSTFSFVVPLREADRAQEESPWVPPTITEGDPGAMLQGRSKPRLLIAEDDQVIRKILGLMFEQAGFELDLAEDGLQAVQMWERGHYQLVFMDVQMPRLDGFEATRAIREKERRCGGHTPIVAMTAHALKEDEERCFSAGMDGYISKPIDFNKCKEMIENILQGKFGEA